MNQQYLAIPNFIYGHKVRLDYDLIYTLVHDTLIMVDINFVFIQFVFEKNGKYVKIVQF